MTIGEKTMEGIDREAGELVELPLAAIDQDDETFRFRTELRVSDLVQEFRDTGQQVPVAVRPHPDRERRFQLVAGFRRCAALRHLGVDTVLAIIHTDLDDETAIVHALRENQYRRPYTTNDRAFTVAKLRQTERTYDQIERLTGYSRQQLQRFMEMTEFPKVLWDAIAAGGVTKPTHGLVLKRALDRHPCKIDLESWIAKIEKHGWSVKKLSQEINRTFHVSDPPPTCCVRIRERNRISVGPWRFAPDKTTRQDLELHIKWFKRVVEILEEQASRYGDVERGPV
jgi:ParB/RepB/Spo0J family partition protein